MFLKLKHRAKRNHGISNLKLYLHFWLIQQPKTLVMFFVQWKWNVVLKVCLNTVEVPNNVFNLQVSPRVQIILNQFCGVQVWVTLPSSCSFLQMFGLTSCLSMNLWPTNCYLSFLTILIKLLTLDYYLPQYCPNNVSEGEVTVCFHAVFVQTEGL